MKRKISILIIILVMLSSCGEKYVYQSKNLESAGYYNNEYVNSVLNIDTDDFSNLIYGEYEWGIVDTAKIRNGYIIVASGGPDLSSVDQEYVDFVGSYRASDLNVAIFDQNSNILRIDVYPLHIMDFVVYPYIVQNEEYIIISGVGVDRNGEYIEYSLFYDNNGNFLKEVEFVFKVNDKVTNIINYFTIDENTYVATKEYKLGGSMNDVGKSYLMKFDKEFNLVFVEEVEANLNSNEVFALKGMVVNTNGEIVLLGTKNNFVEEIDGYIYHNWREADVLYVTYNLGGELLDQEVIHQSTVESIDSNRTIYIDTIKQTTVSDTVYYYFLEDQVINLYMFDTKTKENQLHKIEDIGTSILELTEFNNIIIVNNSDTMRLYEKDTMQLIAEFDFSHTVGRSYVFEDNFYMTLLNGIVEVYELKK